MGLRFRKSLKIAPGVRLNIGNKSTGISIGGKGLRYSVNSRGRASTTIGIPGSGLSYTTSRNYKTKAYQTRNSLQSQQKAIKQAHEKEQAKYEVALFENQCELVKSIHKECDDYLDWQHILTSQPPFQIGEIGRFEVEASRKYANYKLKFLDWLFKREEKIYSQLAKEVEVAREKDLEELNEWKNTVSFAEKILAGDIDTYFQVIDEMNPLGDLSEFGSGFEFSTDDPSYIEVEFDAHFENVIPTEEKKLTQTGKLSLKQMTKTRYFDLQQDYVCSCTIRIARDLFALLPLKTVVVHAYEEKLNTATGYHERVLILSVKIDRAILNSLDLDNIDCSDSMANFTHNMKFKKTKGFESVDKCRF